MESADPRLALDLLWWIACVVLVVSGLAKAVVPTATARTLAQLGAPGGEPAARLLGVIEVVLGVAGLVLSSPAVAGAVAVLYVGFAVVVVLARRAGLDDCGCIGVRPRPPEAFHVAANVVSAAVAAAVAVLGPVPMGESLETLATPVAAVAAVAVAVGAGLVVSR